MRWNEKEEKEVTKDRWRSKQYIPCRWRFNSICQYTQSRWQGNEVAGSKRWRCDECNHYEK